MSAWRKIIADKPRLMAALLRLEGAIEVLAFVAVVMFLAASEVRNAEDTQPCGISRVLCRPPLKGSLVVARPVQTAPRSISPSNTGFRVAAGAQRAAGPRMVPLISAT